MWDEIQDMPGEIFDMPETLDELIPEDEEKFDVEAHICLLYTSDAADE